MSPKWFKWEELIPPIEIPNKTIPFLFDSRLIWTADVLRERYGKMVCNTWLWGGSNTERGFRLFTSETGAKWSSHKFGRALDLTPIDVTAQEIREDILKDPFSYIFRHITELELNISWLHFGTRNWNKVERGILTFSP